MTVILATLF